MTVEKVSIKPRRVSLTADGILTDFDFDFKIFDENDIVVYLLDTSDVATLQTITTDYTVAFDSEDETGTVTFLTAPTDQYTVLMISNADYEQSTDIPKGGGFSEPVVEKAYDLLAIQIQQLVDGLDRAVTLSDTSVLTSVELPDPAVADAPIGWNSTADGLVNNPPGVNQVSVDTDATPDFLGATNADGVLRTSGLLSYIDGGDFITITIANSDIDHDQLTNFVAGEHFTMLDEDGLTSDSDTQAATQQSIKAYVDAQIVSQNEFTELTDTPGSYAGETLKVVRVNAGETALEFVTLNAALVPIADAGAIITATDVEGALQENRTAIDLNTAKVTNATHTGEVTGATVLTVDPTAITNKGAATVASGDLVLISDIDDSNNLKQVTAQAIADLGAGGGAVEVLDEGGSLTAAVSSIDFVGAGVTATNVGSAVTVTIPGGGGGGATLTHDVNQTTHGFSVNDWIYHNGTIYALADASAATTAESIGIVSAVADADNFTVQFGGRITGLTGLTAGEAHFLSETAGAITATAPTTEGAIIKPVLVADSTTTGFIFNMRGVSVTSTTSFFQSFTNASLSSGVLTVTHNLGHKYAQVQIFNNTDNMIMPDDITLVDANSLTVDLTSFGTITGTWNAVVLDTGTTEAFNTPTATRTFTNADLSGGALTFTHDLTDQYPIIQVYDENDQIVVPDNITGTSTSISTIDLTSFGTIAGTWRAVASSIGGTAASTPTNTSYTQSFVDGDLTAGVLSAAHSLGQQYVTAQVFDNNDDLVQPDDITLTDANNLSVDLTSFGTLTGTWNLVIIAAGGTTGTATDLSLTGQAAEDFAIYDGANWVPQGGQEKIKILISSRLLSAADNTVAYTGVGFKPSYIRVMGNVNGTDILGIGYYDGTSKGQFYQSSGSQWQRSVGVADDFVIGFDSAGNSSAGTLDSFDADGFTISWVKTGSPGGTYNLAFECFR
jgi:hypothetical protein